MKRKTKRTGRKKWVAFLAPLGVIIAFVALLFNFLKESTIPILISLIKSWFELDEKSNLPFPILFCFSLATIALLSFIVSRLYLNYNKPNRKYFELIDFKKPKDDVIKSAAEGILNSEKTQPYFVHAAPINDEINQFYKKLDTNGFVWENGKPGDGKSMLAYNAIFRYRKKIRLSFDITTISLFTRSYRAYALKLKNVSEEKEIDLILDELDSLIGGKRKIILIDDAHKLSFEGKLRWEFEEEAKDKLNGKFVWINTNYLDLKQSDKDESISISFEKFYPKLLKELYGSHNPIIKDVVKNNCSALQEAIKLKEEGKIKDPWHFNFIATSGEIRILNLLQKLSEVNEKQEILIIAVFLFSCRNIITGEKEINQTEFANLLTSIEVTYIKNEIAKYQPNNIISDLASQDKGRFFIIENKNSLDRGFLRAPHFKLSIAIIKSVVNHFSESLIKQILSVSKLILTENYADCKYFGIYFVSLGEYQEYYLIENKDWIHKFLTNLYLDQLHVYPFLLSVLKKYHNSFYKELITDDYLIAIASIISLARATRFKSIQEIIQVLGNDKEKLVKNLNWETLANAANKAEVAQLTQVADFINALGNDKEKLVKNLNWETLANAANKAEVAQLTQVADFINALGNDKEKLVKNLNWETLANAANKAEVANFGQLEAILNALGNDKEKLVKNLNWETLANAANKAEVANFGQLEAILNALGNDKEKLVKNLNWETLANAANKAEVAQLTQVADFINALGNDKEKFSLFFQEEDIIEYSKQITWKQISSLCIIIASIETEKQNSIISKCNWINILNKINLNHSIQIKSLSFVLQYHNIKQVILNSPSANQEIIIYLENNREKIVRFSTQYFISPDDFQSCSNLLNVLTQHSIEICRKIAGIIKYKLTRDFSITPRYYKGFSNLLNSLNQISSPISNNIIANNSVKSKLHASFYDKSINDQLNGLQSLLDSMQNINPLLTAEFLALQSIKDLKLEGTENNLTIENINGI